MENIASFFGGIIALAALGLLLFFELSMESVFFVYVIYALIIIVAGALVISIRGSIAALIRTLAGRASRIKPPPREVSRGEGIEEGRKIEHFFNRKTPSQEIKNPLQVKNPLLKNMMEKLKEKKEKPRRKSRFSSLAKKLRGIRIPRPKLPKIRIKKPGKPKKKPGPEIRKAKRKPIPRKIPTARSKPIVKPKPAKPKPGPVPKARPTEPLISRLEEDVERSKGRVASRRREILNASSRVGISNEARDDEMSRVSRDTNVRSSLVLTHKTSLRPKQRETQTPMKKAGMKEAAKPGESCQICGSSKDLKMHYIVPPEKGGTREEENTITLCGTHNKQAEEGMYSENLLRKLRGS